jgi:tRNA(Arg) A34 adenosine deaminase TadA
MASIADTDRGVHGDRDQEFLNLAIAAAKEGASQGTVQCATYCRIYCKRLLTLLPTMLLCVTTGGIPIGAAIVLDNETVLSTGCNQRVQCGSSIHHGMYDRFR